MTEIPTPEPEKGFKAWVRRHPKATMGLIGLALTGAMTAKGIARSVSAPEKTGPVPVTSSEPGVTIAPNEGQPITPNDEPVEGPLFPADLSEDQTDSNVTNPNGATVTNPNKQHKIRPNQNQTPTGPLFPADAQ